MRTTPLLALLMLLGSNLLSAQETTAPYQTTPLHPAVRTLQVEVSGNDQLPPVIALNSDQTITVRFDRLEQDGETFYYSLTHCDARWNPSPINEMEYMNGFNDNPVEYEDYSYNTFTPYTHYEVTLPNSSVEITASGNYLLKVYPQSDPEHPILHACFSVYEEGVVVLPSVTTLTDMGHNNGYQQLAVEVDYTRYRQPNLQTDMQVVVSQNGRRDNEVVVTTPSYVRGNRVGYDHNRQLIFEAGNEYRRFEMVSVRYAGIGVESIRMEDPFYHVRLRPTSERASHHYIYDQTQQGRYRIRQSDATDSHLEADYMVVHFALNAPRPYLQGNLYVDGYFTQPALSEEYRMHYNEEARQYETTLLLKQGSYNYQYLYQPQAGAKATPARVEGNFSESVNEYLVKVYYRPFGKLYDHLIGVGVVRTGE